MRFVSKNREISVCAPGERIKGGTQVNKGLFVFSFFCLEVPVSICPKTSVFLHFSYSSFLFLQNFPL